MKKIAAIVLGLIVAVVSVLLLLSNLDRNREANLDNFAKCLTGKGIVMYGAYWCSHCQNEKNAFGDSFQFVNYVECTEKPSECSASGIESYPTWILPGGGKLVGEQGVSKLQEVSGCPLFSDDKN